MPRSLRVVRRSGVAIASAALALAPCGAGGQTLPVGDPIEEYVRILHLLGKAEWRSVDVRPVWRVAPVADTTVHPWRGQLPRDSSVAEGAGPRVVLDPVRLRLYWNSAFPYGGHDGAVWQGEGLTSALDAGGTVAWGPLSLTLRPVLIYNQNGSFPLAPVTRAGAQVYGDPWRRMDLPQRFGPDPYWTLDPGQSTVRLTWRGVTAGFGTESLWWGPGIENGILMSDNAPGFPHAFLATAHPVDIGVGTIDAQWIWGRLQATPWLDTIPDAWYEERDLSERRFFTGAVASYRPKGLEQITLGAARAFVLMIPRGGLAVGDHFLIFQRARKVDFVTDENPTGEDLRDQLFSLFARWALPGSGFEVYVEWARNDHFYDFRNLLLEPEHSQGYTLGTRQAVPLSGNRILSLQAELTHLEKPSTSRILDYSTYYEHWAVPAGYTQRGQVLGAEVGPAGNGQSLTADLYAPWGRAGVFLERRVRDNDAYWVVAERDSLMASGHDVRVGGGVRALWFLETLDLGAQVALTQNLDRYFVPRNDVFNVNLAASVRWHRRAGAPRTESHGGAPRERR